MSMSEFIKDVIVDPHDVDYNGIARASSIMKYIQSAAEAQLTEGGMSYEELKAKKRAFILSRIRLEIYEPIRECRPLRAVSYPSESRGYSFFRCYRIESEGATIARAISVWALVDTETRGLVRVNDFELGITPLPPINMEIGRVNLPDTLIDVGGYGVHYGDVDRNMHMNNTKYPDMYSNFLPLKSRRIKAITVNYQNEAKIGDKLRVMRAEADGLYYFRTVRSDGLVNSEAEIELCDL